MVGEGAAEMQGLVMDLSEQDEDAGRAPRSHFRSRLARALLAGSVLLLLAGAVKTAALDDSPATGVKKMAGLVTLDMVPGTDCPAGCCPHENWFCCKDATHCAATQADCPKPFEKHDSITSHKLIVKGGECLYNNVSATEPYCFPGEALVNVRGAASRAMSGLRVSDEVLVSVGTDGNIYEPVLGFMHVLRGAPAPAGGLAFVAVTHVHGVFRASANHLVFASGEDKRTGELVVGDVLDFEGTPSQVLSLRKGATVAGLYAPLTASGRIFVDGVLASVYAGPAGVSHLNRLSHGLLHTMFFPARLYYTLGLADVLSVGDSHKGSVDLEEEMSALVDLYYNRLRLPKLHEILS